MHAQDTIYRWRMVAPLRSTAGSGRETWVAFNDVADLWWLRADARLGRGRGAPTTPWANLPVRLQIAMSFWRTATGSSCFPSLFPLAGLVGQEPKCRGPTLGGRRDEADGPLAPWLGRR